MSSTVGPLSARVGVGPLGINFSREASLQFRRCWSKQALAWRCACPVNPVAARLSGKIVRHFSHLHCTVVPLMAAAEIDAAELVCRTDGWVSPFRLFIGRVPAAIWQRPALYVDIPLLACGHRP